MSVSASLNYHHTITWSAPLLCIPLFVDARTLMQTNIHLLGLFFTKVMLQNIFWPNVYFIGHILKYKVENLKKNQNVLSFFVYTVYDPWLKVCVLRKNVGALQLYFVNMANIKHLFSMSLFWAGINHCRSTQLNNSLCEQVLIKMIECKSVPSILWLFYLNFITSRPVEFIYHYASCTQSVDRLMPCTCSEVNDLNRGE